MTDTNQASEGELDDILDTLAEKSADSDSRLGYVDAYVFAQEAKQALTSLIKELVAEAKPGRADTQIWRENPDDAWDMAVDQFEQNLLKELEEL